jgi:hypothetical protein
MTRADVDVRHVIPVSVCTMMWTSNEPIGQKEGRVMADKQISPKAPEKSEVVSSKTAAARVSKKKAAKKKMFSHKKAAR